MIDKIINLNKYFIVEDLEDIEYHVKKQNLKLDVSRISKLYLKQHLAIYGSSEHLYGHEHTKFVYGRKLWVEDKVWDTLDCSCKVMQVHKMLKEHYLEG